MAFPSPGLKMSARASLLADDLPPTPDARENEFGRVVMGGVNVRQRAGRRHLIDAVWGGLPFCPMRKIIDIHGRQFFMGMSFPTRISQGAHPFFSWHRPKSRDVPRLERPGSACKSTEMGHLRPERSAAPSWAFRGLCRL